MFYNSSDLIQNYLIYKTSEYFKMTENFVIEYLENDGTEFMYFHADNEEHAIEQFNEFFKDYDAHIELIHCGYIVG